MTTSDKVLEEYLSMNPFQWLEGHLGFVDKHVSGDLEQSILALGTILTFLHNSGVPSAALSRLHIQLFELSCGSPPAGMLKKRTQAKRPQDRVSVAMAKAALAGIMEAKMRSGMTEQEAAQWVINHTSTITKKKVHSAAEKLKASTIAKWRERFNGAGEPGPGRSNYRWIVSVYEEYEKSGRGDQAERLLKAIEGHLIPMVTSSEESS